MVVFGCVSRPHESSCSVLRGIDLNSFPIIRDWIQVVIREALSEFLTPRYVEVSLEALLREAQRYVKNEDASRPGCTLIPFPKRRHVLEASKENANMQTRLSKNAMKKIFVDDAVTVRQLRRVSLIKPKTEVARLAMERWMEKTSLSSDDTGLSDGTRDSFSAFFNQPWTLVSPVLALVGE